MILSGGRRSLLTPSPKLFQFAIDTIRASLSMLGAQKRQVPATFNAALIIIHVARSIQFLRLELSLLLMMICLLMPIAPSISKHSFIRPINFPLSLDIDAQLFSPESDVAPSLAARSPITRSPAAQRRRFSRMSRKSLIDDLSTIYAYGRASDDYDLR